MLFKKDQKIAIRDGRQTLTFRRWASPQAKIGGQYNIPPFGAIEVIAIAEISLNDISTREAQRAGYEDLAEANTRLKDDGKTLYRIEIKFLGTAPVKIPDRSTPQPDAMSEILAKLDRWASWSYKTLAMIHADPGTRAGDLAPNVNQDTPTFKRNVRKLKALGLTISLETGYQLSDRGIAALDAANSREKSRNRK
ncbi:MAG: hypothetical protein GKR90_22205 [Pseudomonadales bacterium]|nr:hypothetical protein [Pseudomonadales bacterium]